MTHFENEQTKKLFLSFFPTFLNLCFPYKSKKYGNNLSDSAQFFHERGITNTIVDTLRKT